MRDMSKGKSICSQTLQFLGQTFTLEFFPCGKSQAYARCCSLFLHAAVPCEIDFHLKGRQKRIEVPAGGCRDSARGDDDFGPQPDLSKPVEISVCFIKLGGKDADNLRKEFICQYEKETNDLTAQKNVLEKEAEVRFKELVTLRRKAEELEDSKSKVAGMEAQNTRLEKECVVTRKELEKQARELASWRSKVEHLEGQKASLEGLTCSMSKLLSERKLEVEALEGILAASSDSARHRERRLSRAATRIQTTWRMFACRTLMRSRLAERRRSVKHGRELTAALRVQLAWRLYQKRLQRRWRSKVSKSQTTLYDAVLALESLAQFLSTGEIPFLQHTESVLQLASEVKFRVVAVVGLFDKGKTWLTNKLFGVNLPSGKLHTSHDPRVSCGSRSAGCWCWTPPVCSQLSPT